MFALRADSGDDRFERDGDKVTLCRPVDRGSDVADCSLVMTRWFGNLDTAITVPGRRRDIGLFRAGGRRREIRHPRLTRCAGHGRIAGLAWSAFATLTPTTAVAASTTAATAAATALGAVTGLGAFGSISGPGFSIIASIG